MKDNAASIPEQSDVSPEEIPSVALMWVHLAWLVSWPIALIIWLCIKDKHPQARAHGENIVYAYLSLVIYSFVAVVPMVFWDEFNTLMKSTIICLVCVILSILVHSVIKVAIAARNGKVLRYWWAIRPRAKTPIEYTLPEGSPSTSIMWMHISWLPCGLVAFIIWLVVKHKHPQANTHGKNILNAFFTFFLIYFASLFFYLFIMVALISFGFVAGEVHWDIASVSFTHPNPLPFFIMFAWLLCMFICIIASSVSVGLAAKRGEVLPYWWAIRFCKT